MIWLLLLSLTLLTVKSDSLVIVRPTDSDPSVCEGHAVCDTLSNLITNKPAIFSNSSNLNLKFFQGEHLVKISARTKIQVQGKKQVKWHGTDSVIVCHTELIFVFESIKTLEINGITFIKCGSKIQNNNKESMLDGKSAALFLNNVSMLHFFAVKISHSKGYGLFVLNQNGEAHIGNSSFLDNNKDCKPNPDNVCMGGNLALYFLTQVNIGKNIVFISITNCVIKSGHDLSEQVSTCNDRQKKPSSPSHFVANGLAVIFAQDDYQVEFHVSKTLFLGNARNARHPAVLIHDYSAMVNNVEFQSNNFNSEGTLSMFSQSNMSQGFFMIKNCSFHNGTDTPAIDICALVTERLNYNTVIKITNCRFYEYSFFFLPTYKEVAAMIKASISQMVENSNTLIEISFCKFYNNTIPFISIYIHPLSLEYMNSKQLASILTIKGTKFDFNEIRYRLQNGYRKKPFILIEGFHTNTFSEKMISTANFINCSFSSIKNDRGILRVRNAHITLRNCNFFKCSYTALYAENSVVTVDGWNEFSNNFGRYGGALNLNRSMMFIMPNARTHFKNNAASFGGGVFAIPIQPNFSTSIIGTYSHCTFIRSTNDSQAEVIFENNEGYFGGHSIFGGKYINCTYNCTGSSQCKLISDVNALQIPQYISIISLLNDSDTKYLQEVSSPANRICLCENGKPTNRCNSVEKAVFPGQKFNISLIALGELNGSVAATMTVKPRYFKLNIDNQLQFSALNCEIFNYSVHKIQNYWEYFSVRISKDTPELVRSKSYTNFRIYIKWKDCPLGLEISPERSLIQECKCSPFIGNYNMTCDTRRGLIYIKDKQWIRFHKSKIAVTAKYSLDYLTGGEKYINLSKPDEQCGFNRSGVLCGVCQDGLSMVLGTSNCKKCSNNFLLLIIPFALAGVALVVLLLKCNLTVSVGHINGLIFYANIVQVNKVWLFPNQTTASHIFSTFIAWLNLDLGMETCFFNGMGSLTKVWLQFVFPVYLWIMVGLIILAARVSSRLNRLIGNNSVPVLATLFLLSYAKLLRSVIAAMSFTYIEFEDGTHIMVWLYDGHLDYSSPEHAPLFVFAILFLLTFIFPLTLLVLLAPCLQAGSHYKPLRWVNKLKPFLDAYQGPYSDQFRYWTGLLLLARLILFLIYTTNFANDVSVNSFWTVTVAALLASVLLHNAVYRHRVANWIELVSVSNIVIVFSVNWLSNKTEYKKELYSSIGNFTTYISVVFLIVSLLFIILYQQKKLYLCASTKQNQPSEQTENIIVHNEQTAPTSSVVELDELKEPLLDSD